jgi:hypothetical protein
MRTKAAACVVASAAAAVSVDSADTMAKSGTVPVKLERFTRIPAGLVYGV